jgi:hypothetical protein
MPGLGGNLSAMSNAVTARRTARRASDSTWLEMLTRAGFIGYGLLHLAIAWLAIQIAVHHYGANADQSGAFRLLEKQPAGRVLLIVVAVGLAAMAVWQLLLAFVGHNEYTGRRRAVERAASIGRTIIYGALCWTAAQVLSGSATSSASSQQNATAGVLAHPSGRALVTAAGIVVVVVGVGLIVYGVRRSFEPKLKIGQMTPAVRRGVIGLGQVGYIAKGAAFAIVGALLFDAALADNANRSRGLDGALRTLAGQPFGGVLLAIVAAGFAAFGVYCFFQAKYRKV